MPGEYRRESGPQRGPLEKPGPVRRGTRSAVVHRGGRRVRSRCRCDGQGWCSLLPQRLDHQTGRASRSCVSRSSLHDSDRSAVVGEVADSNHSRNPTARPFRSAARIHRRSGKSCRIRHGSPHVDSPPESSGEGEAHADRRVERTHRERASPDTRNRLCRNHTHASLGNRSSGRYSVATGPHHSVRH